jgi:hypothetical protein
MPESFLERLSRFTPDGSGLDRDALLFAAGRASVRPHRGWIVAAGALAACQLLTLALLWPRSAPPISGIASTAPAPRMTNVSVSPADALELGSMNRRFLVSDDEDLPSSGQNDDLVPIDPPLRAFAAPTPAGLD